jgi:hypothetical protein
LYKKLLFLIVVIFSLYSNFHLFSEETNTEISKPLHGKSTVVKHLSFTGGIGYHVPMSSWWDIMTGIISFDTSIKIIRIPKFIGLKNFTISVRPGFKLSYSIGINKPGFNKFSYHSLLVALPIEFVFGLFNTINIAIGTGVQLILDFFVYHEQTSNYTTYPSAAFSIPVNLAVEYFFTNANTYGIGLDNQFNLSIYNPFYASYKALFYFVYQFPERGKK